MCGLLQNFPRFFHGICRASRAKKQLRYIKPPFYQLMLMLSPFCSLKRFKSWILFLGFQTRETDVERFIAKEGKAYFSSGNLFGDFMLEVIGEIDSKRKKCGRVGLCMFDHESGESWVKVRIPHCITLARVLLHVGQSHHSNNLMSKYLILIYIFFTFTLLGNWKYINQ